MLVWAKTKTVASNLLFKKKKKKKKRTMIWKNNKQQKLLKVYRYGQNSLVNIHKKWIMNIPFDINLNKHY